MEKEKVNNRTNKRKLFKTTAENTVGGYNGSVQEKSM